jgi:pyruvate dehydrogenase E1 component
MTAKSSTGSVKSDDLAVLAALEKKALWLSSWMIHNANHLRENLDGMRSGGTRPPPPRSPPS